MTSHQNWEDDTLLCVGETKRHAGLAVRAMNCAVRHLAITRRLSNSSSACNTSLILCLNTEAVMKCRGGCRPYVQ